MPVDYSLAVGSPEWDEAVARALYERSRKNLRYAGWAWTFETWKKWWIEKLGPDWVNERRKKGFAMYRIDRLKPHGPDNVKLWYHSAGKMGR